MKPVQDKDWPDDGTLMAFADGQLEAGEAERVARHLETDPEARRLVELFRRSANIAATAFDEALNVPPSKDLVDKIMTLPSGSDASRRDNVVSIGSRLRKRIELQGGGRAIAASIVAIAGGIIGFGAGHWLGSQPPAVFEVAVGPVAPGSDLEALLESRASGDPVAFRGQGASEAGELIVMASFRDRVARVCREFEATYPNQQSNGLTVAIACRSVDGRWVVEGAARVASLPPVPDKDFSPAGGTSASAIDGILAAIGAKPALSKAEEGALLGKSWK